MNQDCHIARSEVSLCYSTANSLVRHVHTLFVRIVCPAQSTSTAAQHGGGERVLVLRHRILSKSGFLDKRVRLCGGRKRPAESWRQAALRILWEHFDVSEEDVVGAGSGAVAGSSTSLGFIQGSTTPRFGGGFVRPPPPIVVRAGDGRSSFLSSSTQSLSPQEECLREVAGYLLPKTSSASYPGLPSIYHVRVFELTLNPHHDFCRQKFRASVRHFSLRHAPTDDRCTWAWVSRSDAVKLWNIEYIDGASVGLNCLYADGTRVFPNGITCNEMKPTKAKTSDCPSRRMTTSSDPTVSSSMTLTVRRVLSESPGDPLSDREDPRNPILSDFPKSDTESML